MTAAPDDDPIDRSYDRTLLRRLLLFLRPHKGAVAAAFLLIVVMAALDLVPPYLTKVAIDRYIARGDASGLPAVAALYLLTLVLAFAVRFAQVYILQLTGQRVMLEMRRRIFGHLQRLHVGFFDKNPVGRLMTRVTSDVDAVNELFTSGVVTVFGDVFTLFGIMAVMLWLDWRLALTAFAVIPGLFLVTNWFRRGSRRSFREVRRLLARINAFLQEHLVGMGVVQLFRREARAREAFSRVNREHTDANVRQIFYYAVFYPAVDVLAAVAVALILLHGGERVLRGGLTMGALVAFIQYSERFWRPISDLSEKFNILQSAMASSERIFTLLDTRIEVLPPPQPVRLPGVQGKVAFEDVWFRYAEPAAGGAAAGPDDESWVLRDIAFNVEPGRTLALVGATGAGKTSIISLLARFYDPQRGRVTIDGVDVRQLDPAQLRRSVGLVLQDVHLFSGTIASNIRLGSDIPEDRVRQAARAVNIERFIEALPGGYQSEVRERGATLSVGQKQLLSFARALAHDPRILVLDEATSSVDTETEEMIQQALAVLLRGRTALVIAHRLSTVQSADQILVLHKGRIRERGAHQELLARRGLYWRLYQLQYKDQEVPGRSAAAAAERA